jgi:hypothetical protein
VTGSEHRQEAEKLVDAIPPSSAADVLAKAQVHILIALYDAVVASNARPVR